MRPGLSTAKIWCDLFLPFHALSLMRRQRYDLIYAVEEGAFIAALLSRMFRTPYVFDMDSSMADQIVERWGWLAPLNGTLRWIESLPMRGATAVIPMCEAIGERAREHCRGFVATLKDVSLVQTGEAPADQEDLRRSLGVTGPMIMYVGNL